MKLASNQANLLSNYRAPAGNLLQINIKLSSWRRISKTFLPQTHSQKLFVVLASNIEPFTTGSVQRSHFVLYRESMMSQESRSILPFVRPKPKFLFSVL